MEADHIRAGLRIIVFSAIHTLPAQLQRQLGFDEDFKDGKQFRAPLDCWEELHALVGGLVYARHGRVQARKLASLTGTVLSMHVSLGPVT